MVKLKIRTSNSHLISNRDTNTKCWFHPMHGYATYGQSHQSAVRVCLCVYLLHGALDYKHMEYACSIRAHFTVLSIRRARSRLRSSTRYQVCSASAINRADRWVVCHILRSPEDLLPPTMNGKYKHISATFAASQHVMGFQVSKCDCISQHFNHKVIVHCFEWVFTVSAILRRTCVQSWLHATKERTSSWQRSKNGIRLKLLGTKQKCGTNGKWQALFGA